MHGTRMITLLLPLALAASPVRSAAAPPSARVVLVLDASGSMWGQIDGRPKIEIARETIEKLLEGFDPSVEVGLVAYGHRRKGDCGDIEVLRPPGPVDRSAFRAALEAIQPKGKTPLSEAVRRAAEALRYTEEKATVILVSDGEETCGADPCAVGRTLEASGVDFTAHVIGFDVADPATREQLRCLAESTGGEFLVAADAPSLAEAMRRTAEAAELPAPAPPPPPPPAPAAGEVIEAGCSFTANQIEGEPGSTHLVDCPAGCEGSIWGTDTYTGDSRICVAARHAGLLGEEGGVVQVTLGGPRPAFRGTRRHGIQSSDYGSYGSSYRLAPASGAATARPEPPPPPAPPASEVIEAGCSFTANQIEGEPGSTHLVDCPAGCQGSIWGTDTYTGDSPICVAARHAGLVGEQGGVVQVTLGGPRPAFRGSRRHGIQSSDYGSYGSSYRLAPASGVPAPRPAPPARAPRR